MKVFMLGWEFPPFISGGLGTACYGLTKAMDKLDADITFVLPMSAEKGHSTHVKMLTPDSLSQCSEGSGCCINESIPELLALDTLLRPYQRPGSCKCKICQSHVTQSADEGQPAMVAPEFSQEHYGDDIQFQVRSYAAMASMLARTESYDVIHAHDWMTYYAGVSVARITSKPLVIHVHSTEFDRSGENINQQIYDVERYGMYHADKILAVSNYTRNVIIDRYAVPEHKVSVVHNGMDRDFSSKPITHGFRIRKIKSYKMDNKDRRS